MNLEEIRKNIDNVDDQLLKLFLERMDLAFRVAQYKAQTGKATLDKTREREILKKVAEKAGDMEMYAYHLYQTILQQSKAYQNQLIAAPSGVRTQIERALDAGEAVFPRTGMIACQGIEGGNSQQACDKLFPRGHLMYVNTFEAVLDAVESGLCKFGVLPIENSSNGSVRAVYELLRHRKFSIVRSTRLWIRHELLAKPGTDISQIKTVYSHEQAIGQCSAYLSKLNGVKAVPCANTAVAAKMVAESDDPAAAAISAPGCASLYGLEVLADRIQDSENNYTRFICVTKDPAIYEGANRISLIVATGNTPGALYEVLSKPAALGINMTKLESCPVTGSDFEFMFFIELEASVKEPEVLAMLEDMERSCENFVFLGNYLEV
ncbi:MAG: bifunctional chorismate mutase/prephenate dehydratase [Ruminococcaceae bacterium]|nr:bifunctional chorismate mutase/prephenate dehydratase [Oscillospiraceae bacterium]